MSRAIIDLVAEFKKLGINEPSDQLLDAAKRVIDERFVLRLALVEAFNKTHAGTRTYRRRAESAAQEEKSHE